MGKESDVTKIRDGFIEEVRKAFEQHFNSDCIITGSGVLAIPGVDDEGNEFYYKIQISIPRGQRDGSGGYIPWDAYADAEDYKMKLQERADKKAAKEEAAKKKAEEKKRQKEAKKVVKKLNEKGLDKLIHEKEAAD